MKAVRILVQSGAINDVLFCKPQYVACETHRSTTGGVK